SKRFTASSRMVLSSPTPMCQKVSVFFPLSAEGIQAVKKTKSPTTSNNPGFFMALPLKEEFAYIPKDAYYRNISVSTLTIALLFLFVNCLHLLPLDQTRNFSSNRLICLYLIRFRKKTEPRILDIS